MPRPPMKKRRFNQQSPGNRKRASPSNVGLSDAHRVQLREKLAEKLVGQRPQDSDDSDRLVTRKRNGRRAPEPIFASGGVAKGDKPGVSPSKQQRSQRLRSETEEIIRRSRSKSVEALRQSASKSRSASVVGSKEDSASEPAPIASAPATKSPLPTQVLTKPQSTPAAETSILGTLKPRRRQPSILQMIDNNDSSIVNPEDEEQFLPDDESTPIHVRSSNQQQGNAQQNATSSPGTSSRKRKLGADESIGVTPDSSSTAADPQPKPTLPTQDTVILDSQRQQTAPEVDDDIMALPQSSSDESSPQKPKAKPSNIHKRVPSVPTTEQLQSLMPSKRRKGTRQRKEATEFDIPEDSDSAEVNGVEDESIFQPRKRGKTRGGKDVSIAKTKAKATGKARQVVGPSTPAATKSKSKPNTKSTSTPLKPTVNTPRTPLPLTRNPNQENKAMSLARDRNRSSKPNGGNNATTQNQREKQSGGSHLITSARTTRSGLRSATTAIVGGESDKENSAAPGTLTKSSRKRTTQRTLDDAATRKDVRPSIEVRESIDNEATSPLSDPRGDDVLVRESVVTPEEYEAIPASADAKAWKNKWAGIDDWSLDFEEVEISTGSSSPLLKASVV